MSPITTNDKLSTYDESLGSAISCRLSLGKRELSFSSCALFIELGNPSSTIIEQLLSISFHTKFLIDTTVLLET